MYVRRYLSLPIVLLLAVALSGCIDVRMESEFRADGSAYHALEATIENEGLEELESFGEGGTSTFETNVTQEEFDAAGIDVTPIETDEKQGIRVGKDVDAGTDVGDAFNELFASNAEVEESAPYGAITGTFVKDGNEYRLNLTIDSSLLFDEAEDSSGGMTIPNMENFFNIVYVATLPGDITETNGTEIGDGKVEWKLPLTGTTEIMAVAKGEGSGALGIGGGGISMIAIAGIVGLLAVAAIVGGLLYSRRGAVSLGTNPAPVPAAASVSGAPDRSYGTNAAPLSALESHKQSPIAGPDATE